MSKPFEQSHENDAIKPIKPPDKKNSAEDHRRRFAALNCSTDEGRKNVISGSSSSARANEIQKSIQAQINEVREFIQAQMAESYSNHANKPEKEIQEIIVKSGKNLDIDLIRMGADKNELIGKGGEIHRNDVKDRFRDLIAKIDQRWQTVLDLPLEQSYEITKKYIKIREEIHNRLSSGKVERLMRGIGKLINGETAGKLAKGEATMLVDQLAAFSEALEDAPKKRCPHFISSVFKYEQQTLNSQEANFKVIRKRIRQQIQRVSQTADDQRLHALYLKMVSKFKKTRGRGLHMDRGIGLHMDTRISFSDGATNLDLKGQDLRLLWIQSYKESLESRANASDL